jgi:hypothetical protein
MRCWSVQPVVVWERIQTEGFARVDPGQRPYPYRLPESYLWLSWHMSQRLSLHDKDDPVGIFPWFAYCERPDLRWVRHTQEGAQTLIEFEPPEDRVLSFPSWAWEDIFCGYYLAYTGQEYRAWTNRFKRETGLDYRDADWPLPQVFREELISSWNRLWEPSIPRRSWRRQRTAKREAVVDILKDSWVKKVTHFEGHSKWNI